MKSYAIISEAPSQDSTTCTGVSNIKYFYKSLYRSIHPGYALFDDPNKFSYLKKWYETKNSPKFISRKNTHIKATIVADFLKANFVAPNLSTTHIKFNKKCTEYIKDTIVNETPFVTIDEFHSYIEEIRNDYPISNKYVDLIFNEIRSMSYFSKWLKDNSYRIRMR